MDTAWQFDVAAALVGGAACGSASYESIASNTLQGVQSVNLAAVIPHTDTFGWGGEGNQEVITRPHAEVQVSMLYASGVNERALGFVTSPSGTTSALAGLNQERNFYLLVNQAHQDELTYRGSGYYSLGIGNGVLTHYDLAAQVGRPTLTSATILGLNLVVQSGAGQTLPSVVKQPGTTNTGLFTPIAPTQTVSNYFEAAPSAIQLTFNSGCALGVALSSQNSCPVDSFAFSVELPRAEVKDLGWAYPNNRPIQWPATISIKVDAYVTAFQLDAINRLGITDSGTTFAAAFKTVPNGPLDDFSFVFQGAKLDNQAMSVSVGGGTAKVALDWTLKVYDVNRTASGAPNFFINSVGTAYSSIVFPQVQYVSGQSPLIFNLSTASYLSVVSGPGFVSGGNSVFVSDEASTVVVRAIAADGSDTEDLTVTVG